MSGISLSAYLEELTYAAGPGAAHIASSVTASGHLQAETGIVASMPGPALRSVLARNQNVSRRGAAAPVVDRTPQIADRMAKNALRQGANLLDGNG